MTYELAAFLSDWEAQAARGRKPPLSGDTREALILFDRYRLCWPAEVSFMDQVKGGATQTGKDDGIILSVPREHAGEFRELIRNNISDVPAGLRTALDQQFQSPDWKNVSTTR